MNPLTFVNHSSGSHTLVNDSFNDSLTFINDTHFMTRRFTYICK